MNITCENGYASTLGSLESKPRTNESSMQSTTHSFFKVRQSGFRSSAVASAAGGANSGRCSIRSSAAQQRPEYYSGTTSPAKKGNSSKMTEQLTSALGIPELEQARLKSAIAYKGLKLKLMGEHEGEGPQFFDMADEEPSDDEVTLMEKGGGNAMRPKLSGNRYISFLDVVVMQPAYGAKPKSVFKENDPKSGVTLRQYMRETVAQ